MPLILLFIQYSIIAQHVSAVNTTIFRSLRLTGCYFMGGICKKYRGIVLACYLLGRCWSWFFSLYATIKMMHGPINIISELNVQISHCGFRLLPQCNLRYSSAAILIARLCRTDVNSACCFMFRSGFQYILKKIHLTKPHRFCDVDESGWHLDPDGTGSFCLLTSDLFPNTIMKPCSILSCHL